MTTILSRPQCDNQNQTSQMVALPLLVSYWISLYRIFGEMWLWDIESTLLQFPRYPLQHSTPDVELRQPFFPTDIESTL